MKINSILPLVFLAGTVLQASAQRIVLAGGLPPVTPPSTTATPTTQQPLPSPAVHPSNLATPVSVILPRPVVCAGTYAPPAVVGTRAGNVVYFGGWSSQSLIPPGYPGYSGRYPGSSVVYFGRGASLRQGYYFNRER